MHDAASRVLSALISSGQIDKDDLESWAARVYSALERGYQNRHAADLPETGEDVARGDWVYGLQTLPEDRSPAVAREDSVRQDCLVDLFDGDSSYKQLSWIAKKHGMSVSDYLEHWGLPASYPRAAPGLSDTRAQTIRQTQANSRKPLRDPKKDGPAVAIEEDGIVCLEDGRKFKTLKRHLRVTYDLSPEEYRRRWGLPSDYPMVCSEYREKKMRMAREQGHGWEQKASSEA